MTEIIALEYLEPEYQQTVDCLLDLNKRYFKADREGVGNYAKAMNEGFYLMQREFKLRPGREKPKYVWFISNITGFDLRTLAALEDSMEKTGFAAIVPTYQSDHRTHQPKSYIYGEEIQEIPFVEFTCPIVRFDVFEKIQLNEKLSYYYHDLLWSYEVRQLGYKLGVDLRARVEHTYLRNSKGNHPISVKRAKLRRESVAPGQLYLRQRFGKDWELKLWPK